MAPTAAPPAMRAESRSATPRAGRSRRLEYGYDILLSSRGAREWGGMHRDCRDTAGVAPLWPAFGTMRGPAGARPRTWSGNGVREGGPGFLLLEHFLDTSGPLRPSPAVPPPRRHPS